MEHLKISMVNLNLYFNGADFISIYTFDKLCTVRNEQRTVCNQCCVTFVPAGIFIDIDLL